MWASGAGPYDGVDAAGRASKRACWCGLRGAGGPFAEVGFGCCLPGSPPPYLCCWPRPKVKVVDRAGAVRLVAPPALAELGALLGVGLVVLPAGVHAEVRHPVLTVIPAERCITVPGRRRSPQRRRRREPPQRRRAKGNSPHLRAELAPHTRVLSGWGVGWATGGEDWMVGTKL